MGLSHIIVKHKSGNRVNALENQPGFNPSFAVASKFKDSKYLHQKNANDFSFRSFSNGGSPIKKLKRSVMPMDDGEKEDLLYNTLEKMAIPFEKLEKLFFEKLYLYPQYKDAETKIFNMIIDALGKPDPAKAMEEYFIYHNKQYYSAKMIAYVAKYYDADTFTATELLKNVLLSKYLYK